MYKIAILDDNEDFCLIIQSLLDNYFEISAFTEVSSFLQSFDSQKYDLVLVDFTLGITGYENIKNGCDLIANLKSKLTSPPLFILVTGWLSVNDDLEDSKKICLQADGFLSKNIVLPEIVQYINNLLVSK